MARSDRGSAWTCSRCPEPLGAHLTKSGRPQLVLPLRNRAQFQEQSFDKDEQGGLFVPGELAVELGEEVDLEINFLEEQVRFRIRAMVLWRRAAAGRRALPGVGLGFPPSEQATKHRLLAFVAGESSVDHVEREARRYALHLEVKLETPAGTRTVVTDDLSEGGCFLLVHDPPPIDTAVKITLKAPGALFSWLTLRGRVAWQRTTRDRGGVGVEFLFDNDRQRRRMQKLLALLRERLGREVRVLPPRTPPSTTSTRPEATATRSSLLPRK